MNAQAVPALVMASIVLFLATNHLWLFLRRPRKRAYITFSLTCFAIGLYDVSCVLLYGASSWIEGARWQRLQFVATCFLCAVTPWFLFDFHADPRSVSRRARRVAATATAFLLAAAAAVAANPFGLFWRVLGPRVRTVPTVFGATLAYREAAPGPFADFLYPLFAVLLLCLFLYVLSVRVRAGRRGDGPLAAVMAVALVTALLDVGSSLGLLPLPYTLEYALMGWAMMMAAALSRAVVRAGDVQDALAVSEARYRGIFRDAAVALLEGDIRTVRAGIGELRARGVGDAAAYLSAHPEEARRMLHGIRIVDVNEAMMELFGAERREQLLGAAAEVLHPSTLEQFDAFLPAIAAGRERFRGKGTISTLQGRKLDVVLSAAVLQGMDEICLSIADVTALRRAEEKLRAFLEQSSEAIILVDETGCVAEYNPSAERLLGVPREEALHRPIWDLNQLSLPAERRTPETAEKFKARFLETVKEGLEGVPRPPLQGVLWRPDGTRRDFVQFVFTIRTDRGYMHGSILHDATEERRTEEALRESEQRLRQAQKMEAIGTLAGGIAHDFNNLLTGILGCSSLLLEEVPPEDPMRADLGTIDSSARRAADLTRQLLTFSSRDSTAETGVFDANAVVRELVRLLERTVDKSISITTDLSPTPLWVRGNEGQIHQAVLNLCLNARDAMPRGGTISLSTALECRSGSADRRAAVTVKDTGTGMTEETQRKIFEPFFSTKGSGRGLGLAMVYGIVRGHEGDIEVRSVPGEGTTFRILLPEAAGAPVAEAPRARAGRGGGETVLVIDDEPQVRHVAARILRRAGYAVLQAENGADGIRLFGERPAAVDLVLLDLSMPGLSGTEVFARLQDMDPHVKVLFSSGYSDDERVTEVLEKGVHGFLHKPYTMDSVLRTVRETLDR